MSRKFNEDNSIRPLLTVATVPRNPNSWTSATSPSIPSGSKLNATITTTPDSSILSLWNFLFTIRVDTNDHDHRYPSGSALTDEQRNLELEHFTDFSLSSDTQNIRRNIIRIKNNGASSHVYYFLIKSYTFSSTAAGSQSS